MRILTWTLVSACMGSLAAQTATAWTQRTAAVPPHARAQHGMVYDSQRGRAVLFGGDWYGGSTPNFLGDTWEWDGTSWTQSTPPTAPSPRASFAMAFDTQRQRVVLFGGWQGDTNPLLGDTCEWDGTVWTLQGSAHSPTARTSAAVYDSQRGVVVLFGGRDDSGYQGDTWEWNGFDWTQRAIGGPTPRTGHAMAYDSQHQRTILFGGVDGGLQPATGDTWEWDGSSWVHRTPATSPAARSGHAMAYDSVRHRVILFGGNAPSSGFAGDTWEWDGTTWFQQASSPAPAARSLSALAWQDSRGRTFLFGGLGGPVGQRVETQDSWEFGTPTAAAAVRVFGSGCGTPALTITPSGRPLLGTTQVTFVGNVPNVAFMSVGLSDTAIGTFPLPLALDGFGLPGCWLYQDCIDVAEPCAFQSPGAARHGIAVPNDIGLLGIRVYLQAWAPATGSNAAGLITSNAAELTVGNL
jgi:hypothetical protein